MQEAIGKVVIIACVFLTGAASMVMLEKFQMVPATCSVSSDIYDSLSKP